MTEDPQAELCAPMTIRGLLNEKLADREQLKVLIREMEVLVQDNYRAIAQIDEEIAAIAATIRESGIAEVAVWDRPGQTVEKKPRKPRSDIGKTHYPRAVVKAVAPVDAE